MARIRLTPDAHGVLPTQSVSTDAVHSFIVRTIELEYVYHDDSPVVAATFDMTFPGGTRYTGRLNDQGRAMVIGVPGGEVTVRFGPDAREYAPAPCIANQHYRSELTDAEIKALSLNDAGSGPGEAGGGT